MPLTGGPPRAFLPRGAQHAGLVARRRAARLFSQADRRRRSDVRRRSHGAEPADSRRLFWRRRAVRRHAQQQSGLVAGRGMDLFRQRIGAAERDRRRRVAGSPVGWLAGTAHRQHAAVNYPGADRSAHVAICGARADDGRVRGSGRSTSSADDPTRALGIDQDMSVSASRDGRRVVATVANPSSSCGECRSRPAGR